MEVDYTVTALMFPVIPLIMSVYSSRFHTLSALIRKLHDEYVFENIPPEWENNYIILITELIFLNIHNGFASFGFLFNMLTVFALYLDVL